MEWVRDEIAELKQKIQQDERDYSNATDPAQAERLKKIIDEDEATLATLRGLYDKLSQPSKF
jgi:TATA-binding protein-associated factor Taf7